MLLSVSPSYGATKSINNKANKGACSYIKTNYKAYVLDQWNKNNATDDELIKEINYDIAVLSNKYKTSNGSIKTQIRSMILIEKQLKASLVNKNTELFANGISNKVAALSVFDSLCKSIGK